MKKPMVAFTLSFFLPGAGLAYLGKWTGAALNLFEVIGLVVVADMLLPEAVFRQYAHLIAIALGSISGGLAYGLARQMNLKTDSKRLDPH
jgi:hypothetical protein